MKRHVVHRFLNKQAADTVLVKLKRIVRGADCSVSLEDDLSESDVKRGVGKWAIIFEMSDDTIVLYSTTQRMSDAVNYALTLALADALYETNPKHCLLTTWHLNPDNRQNIATMDFSDSLTRKSLNDL